MAEPVMAYDPTLLLQWGWSCRPNASGAGNRPYHRETPGTPISVEPASVLIVDDDATVRETLAELLDLEGYATIQASDAEAAVKILQRAGVSVMVTDLSMPGDDGIALIRRARQMERTMPAILLTGYAEDVAAVSTIAGANIHVLRKPVEARHLLQQIASLLQIERDTD